MKRALWLVGLVGCVDGDTGPTGPIEIELISALDVVSYHLRQQRKTVLGGTQTFELHYGGTTAPGIPGAVFEWPYKVMIFDQQSAIRVEDQRGPSFTIRGVATGSTTLLLRHEDGSPLDEVTLSVAEVKKIALVPRLGEELPGDLFPLYDQSFVWAPGDHDLDVTLHESGGFFAVPLADTSMEIALAGAERTSLSGLHIPGATAGTHPISVTTGEMTTTADFVVVDHADSVSLTAEPPASLESGQGKTLCFQARNAGRYVVGARWTFSVVGQISNQSHYKPNCISFVPQQTSGDITVNASALDQSVSMTFPIVAM